MICKNIDIWENLKYQGKADFRPTLATYILNRNNEVKHNDRPAVLICPGGGYGFTSEREAEPIAAKFNAAGFQAFVIYYSVAPNKHPQPLLDVSRAMCIIRENAEEWGINKDKIIICGFSAGGHLAASLGVHWNKQYLFDVEGIEMEMNKPNGLILSYPVITSGEFAHRGSFDNLLGEHPNKELLEEMSLENQIGEHTPKTFIWHTFEDGCVPMENTLLFAQGLRKNNIPFEMHIYPEGGHGLSLANEETTWPNDILYTQVSTWINMVIEWIKRL